MLAESSISEICAVRSNYRMAVLIDTPYFRDITPLLPRCIERLNPQGFAIVGIATASANSLEQRMTARGRESSPGEFHPEALAEPYVNVSAHTAPIIQPGKGHQDANAQTALDGSELPAQANAGRVWSIVPSSCISA